MRHGKFHGFSCAVVAMVLMGTLASPGLGRDRLWVVGGGLWNDPFNWDYRHWEDANGWHFEWNIPTPDETAYINNGGTATIVAEDDLYVYGVNLGDLQSGSVVQSAGTLHIGVDLNVAWALASSSGTYTLHDGLLQTNDGQRIGYQGTGLFIQDGGRNVADYFQLGSDPSASGTYLFSGGTLEGQNLDVGWEGTGTFDQSGGTNKVQVLELGGHAGAYGTYTLSGGSLQTSLWVRGGGTGIFTQTDGTKTGGINLGNGLGGAGVYNFSGGSISGGINVGGQGTGTFNQSGGTAVTSGVAIFGGGTCGSGTYNLSDGSLKSDYDEVVGSGGALGGTFNQTGGTNTITGSLHLHANGIYNLSNSPLSMNSLTISGNGAIFNQTSGVTSGEMLIISQGVCNLDGGSFGITTGESVGTSDYVIGIGVFNQSGGTNTTPRLRLGFYEFGQGTYNLSGGRLDVGGTISVGQLAESGGTGVFKCTGGTATAGRLEIGRGSIWVGKGATVTAGQIFLTANTSGSPAMMQFELGSTGAGHIHSTGGSSSTVDISPGDYGLELLDLQANAGYRPNQGDTFHVMIGFGSISGTFSAITTNLEGWLRTDRDVAINLNDPNTYRPIFSGAVIDANGAHDYVATFQGARSGDATGDNRVNSTDLSVFGAHWLKPGGTFTWLEGDFNGDGNVNSTDLAALGANWLWTGPWPGPAPMSDAPLPEPATLALLAMGGLALVRGRKR